MRKPNYKPIIVFMGIVLVAGSIVVYALDPTIMDEYTKAGTFVKFDVYVDRVILTDPNIVDFKATEVTYCSNLLSVSTASLDTKVEVVIGSYKSIETTTITTPWSGGGGWVSGCTFIPYGNYQITYKSYNIGGEICNPLTGCTWQLDDTVTKSLSVSELGVNLT